MLLLVQARSGSRRGCRSWSSTGCRRRPSSRARAGVWISLGLIRTMITAALARCVLVRDRAPPAAPARLAGIALTSWPIDHVRRPDRAARDVVDDPDALAPRSCCTELRPGSGPRSRSSTMAGSGEQGHRGDQRAADQLAPAEAGLLGTLLERLGDLGGLLRRRARRVPLLGRSPRRPSASWPSGSRRRRSGTAPARGVRPSVEVRARCRTSGPRDDRPSRGMAKYATHEAERRSRAARVNMVDDLALGPVGGLRVDVGDRGTRAARCPGPGSARPPVPGCAPRPPSRRAGSRRDSCRPSLPWP